MSKYTEALDKIEPNEQKKQEFLYKTLQRKKEIQSNDGKTESRQKFPVTWKTRRAVIAASVIAVLLFCAIAIPLIANNGNPPIADRVVILDASASMLAKQANGKTRFENSIEKAREEGRKAISDNKQISVLLAGKEAKTIVSTKSLDEFNNALDNLECTYGWADIDGARALADDILSKNRKAEVTLYTATKYQGGDIEVVDVFENEWNAAILDVSNPIDSLGDEELVDGYYKFEVTVASYNRDTDIIVYFEARGANSELRTITAQKTIYCKSNQPVVFQFEGLNIYEYDSVRVYINTDDSFDYDNELYLYDGRKEIIKMLYVSPAPNLFFRSVLHAMREGFKKEYEIELAEGNLNTVELKGYDFYIIEHEIPQKLPADGLVWLINPDITPEGSGLILGETVFAPNSEFFTLSAGQSSPIMNYVNPNQMEVYRYRKITSYDDYEVLMYCGEDPALMVKNEMDAKIVILSFALNYSNLGMLSGFSVITYNLIKGLFSYFLPPTITEYIFEVDEQVNINARGAVLQVNNAKGFEKTYNTFPNITVPPIPGAYTLTQTLMSGRVATDKFFVKLPVIQSNFSRTT